MIRDLVPVLSIISILLGIAGIMIAYRRRRGRIEVKYGGASVTYASPQPPRSRDKGVVIQESSVVKSTLDVPKGADARIETSTFRDSSLVIREPGTARPATRPGE
jgi:hypothetical protein